MSVSPDVPRERVIGLTGAVLDQLMPMHIWVSATGGIVRMGPTLRKILRGEVQHGMQVLDVMRVEKPRKVDALDNLFAMAGRKLHVSFQALPGLHFKGALFQLPAGVGGLINLSFGLNVIDAVGRFGLTLKDFAPTDLTVEMLYLVEAKTAAMEESKSLNRRLQDARIEAEEQAFTDTLTGLRNRRALDHVLDRLTEAPTEELFGLMHIDLDFFKQVNDTLGHAAGDHVLRHVARILTHETREGDLVARVGGDEFVVIFRDCNDLTLLDGIARRMIEKLEEPIRFEGETCRISASIGTTVSSYYALPRSDEMLNDADQALYASKNKGRAQHTIFNPEAESATM
ncbi:MAG: diguanylate cyclase domain-containing protein [Brevirhabdus sp.]